MSEETDNYTFSSLQNDNVVGFNLTVDNANRSDGSGDAVQSCTFKGIKSLEDIILLISNHSCHKHSVGFTVFLCFANLLILAFGLLGNSLVIYVVAWKIKRRTASTLFIFNLCVADMLVIVCCIPATLVANIFNPWIFGQAMCKAVAYAQGVSVFCSVSSLVAISFDRFRAIHQSAGLSPNLTESQALKIIIFIWILGLTVTLPWTVIFKLKYVHSNENDTDGFPFCYEAWQNKNQEILYFLLIHVFLCYLLPLGLITVCNAVIWKNVLEQHQQDSSSSFPPSSHSFTSVGEKNKRRKLRVLKLFTVLSFVFFLFWLPLYLIMARVKLFYDDAFTGSLLEQKLIIILIPIAQLLGSCNSCVNPVMYALLNQKFRESFKSVVICPSCQVDTPPSSIAIATIDNNSLATVVVPRLPFTRDTAI